VLRSKSKIRSTKSETNPKLKAEMFKTRTRVRWRSGTQAIGACPAATVLVIRIFDFVFVSDFGFRASDLAAA
jgi:hypothetical protein